MYFKNVFFLLYGIIDLNFEKVEIRQEHNLHKAHWLFCIACCIIIV